MSPSKYPLKLIAATTVLVLAAAAQAQQQAKQAAPADYVRTAIEEGAGNSRETTQYIATGENWPAGNVYWYYNPINQPLNLKTSEVMASIQVAMSRWAQMCNLSFTYLGTSTANRNFEGGTVDRINVIGWASFPIDMRGSSGVTYWNFSRSTLAMLDADVVLNTRESWTPRDVEAVMTHEVGHMIGIEHSNTTASIMSAAPYNTYEYQRTLRGDDVAACTKLYGASPLALTNRTLNWAEKNYPAELKAGPAVTQGDSDGFVYRYYSGSNSKAGVKNGTAYYVGPNGVMQNMGPLSGFTPQVQAAGF